MAPARARQGSAGSCHLLLLVPSAVAVEARRAARAGPHSGGHGGDRRSGFYQPLQTARARLLHRTQPGARSAAASRHVTRLHAARRGSRATSAEPGGRARDPGGPKQPETRVAWTLGRQEGKSRAGFPQGRGGGRGLVTRTRRHREAGEQRESRSFAGGGPGSSAKNFGTPCCVGSALPATPGQTHLVERLVDKHAAVHDGLPVRRGLWQLVVHERHVVGHDVVRLLQVHLAREFFADLVQSFRGPVPKPVQHTPEETPAPQLSPRGQVAPGQGADARSGPEPGGDQRTG